MPPKQKIQAPIDRPLSRAYLREFSGWSTAHPPGLSEPTSVRIMENTMVARDGSMRVRPGMRYLSYELPPSDIPADDTYDPGAGGTDGTVNALLSVGQKTNQIGVSHTLTANYILPDGTKVPVEGITTHDSSVDPDGTGPGPETEIGAYTRDEIGFEFTDHDHPTTPEGQWHYGHPVHASWSAVWPMQDRSTWDVEYTFKFTVDDLPPGEVWEARVYQYEPGTNGTEFRSSTSLFSFDITEANNGTVRTFISNSSIHGVYGDAEIAGVFFLNKTHSAEMGYDLSSSSSETGYPQVINLPPQGKLTLTLPEQCLAWFGDKIAETTDDTDEPYSTNGVQVPALTANVFTYPDIEHIVRTEIAGYDERGEYVGYQYFCDDTGGTNKPASVAPTMTSNTTPSPYVVSQEGGDYDGQEAWKAFDKDLTTWWGIPSAPSTWIAIDLSTSTAIASYRLTGSPYLDRNPKDWTLEGSADGVAWTVLDTRAGTTVPADTEVEYPLSESVTYRHYRLNISANGGDLTWISLKEIDLWRGSEATPKDDDFNDLIVEIREYAVDSDGTDGGGAIPAKDLPYYGGLGSDRPFVGTHEAFYLNDGTKAYLIAVREEDETVGFRVLVPDVEGSTLYALDHDVVGFKLRHPPSVLNFSADTTYVKYVQVDNKIFALSDNGEPMRMFAAGADKEAKALTEIVRPEWRNSDKLSVVHPDAAWVDSSTPDSRRRNRLHNPSFEANFDYWNPSPRCVRFLPLNAPVTPVSGSRVLRVGSKPKQTNLVKNPLRAPGTNGVGGWLAVGTGADVVADGDYLKLSIPDAAGLYFARTRNLEGIDGGAKYKVAFGVDAHLHVTGRVRVRFFSNSGKQVGNAADFTLKIGSGRYTSPAFSAPRGAVVAQVFLGGDNTGGPTNIRFRNVVLCEASEDTAFFDGESGDNYFWEGTAHNSASTFHPPVKITLASAKAAFPGGSAVTGSLHLQAASTARSCSVSVRTYDRNGAVLDTYASAGTDDTAGAWARVSAGSAATAAKATQADVLLEIPNVPRGEFHFVDAGMLESGASVPGAYFDGSTSDSATVQHSWAGKPHASHSYEETYLTGGTVPAAETPTTDTLVATGGPDVNRYSFGFFYTFSNEVGESAASKVTVRRTQRAWSEWLWETPDVAGAPSGTATSDAEEAADQLVAIIPSDVYYEALEQGAVEWSLYMMTWSDQEPVPVEALKVGSRELPYGADYDTHGWIRLTAAQVDATDTAVFPTQGNRYNYSKPSHGGQGLAASDRMIMVNDPTEAAVIKWSSNLPGEYTNFTASKGGGYKTLTSGNLFVPACVKLWQNPQSVDTLTILCMGTDGHSTSYYMAPSQVAAQSDATNVMGFEETTATPGTTSPYGVEVLNNALYHPLETELMKSTASNYNISHRPMTDDIANMWRELDDKYWIISSQLDNRLYYLVHNPAGETLEDGCKGNELWVFDSADKTGNWSRFLIQGHALRKIELGGKVYMSVIRPDGVYYLDETYGLDDWVLSYDKSVRQRSIEWQFETNTQGANRAHDAWAHLQQVSVILGNFIGAAEYGVRGKDVSGYTVEKVKVVQDDNALPADGLPFDLEDHLRVARDMKEWHFFARSIPGVPSSGQVSLVQYRYTPVSVNVGYDYGTVESFEYQRNVASGNDAYSTNGVPTPYIDTGRP